MTENKNLLFLKIVLIIYAVVCLIYGLGYLLVPNSLVEMSGGDPVYHGWLRWAGGILVGLGIGSILVYLKPQGQGIFVTTIALGSLLAGLALVWAWIGIEGEGIKVWFTALPAILVLVLSCLLWWSRQSTKSILYPD